MIDDFIGREIMMQVITQTFLSSPLIPSIPLLQILNKLMCLATTACLKDAPLSSRSRLHISGKSFSRVVSTLTTKDIQALLSQWVYVADMEEISHHAPCCSPLPFQLWIRLSEADRKFHLQPQAQCRGIRIETRHYCERFKEVPGKKHWTTVILCYSAFSGVISRSCARIWRFL